MKIEVLPYDPEWPLQFESLKSQLATTLHDFAPVIEHIGSTSVAGLAAKPVIDVAVGLKSREDLDTIVPFMLKQDFIYYEVFNADMPERRLFLGLKEPQMRDFRFQSIYRTGDAIPHEAINRDRNCHIHCWVLGSTEWTRHIAFREYLRHFPEAKKAYGDLKEKLSEGDWTDGMEYNRAKNSFVKETESKAVEWYPGIDRSSGT